MPTFPRRPITPEDPLKINFVCLGNICRSPTAEGVFQHIVKEDGLANYFIIDSSGTGAWHVGQPANSKSQMIAEQRGVKLLSRARQVVASDLDYFDLTVAMDNSNVRDLSDSVTSVAQAERIIKLRDFDATPDDGQVPDPYHGGMDGFDKVFDIVDRSCRNLLNELKKDIK